MAHQRTQHTCCLLLVALVLLVSSRYFYGKLAARHTSDNTDNVRRRFGRESSLCRNEKIALSALQSWEYFYLQGISQESAGQLLKERDTLLRQARQSGNPQKTLMLVKGIGEKTARKLLEQIELH
jgi:hypothetical protein